ncbi:hypothetical protein EHW97_14740 [Aeromicrobium camelliae]|uniref:PrgI family protein n=2 Tax=Aeromicrobium TaxID=2040 RepID=A0A3N6W3G7_9ACTN|nr:SCO6880 family protein [Aeromicrobium camelliae]RQN02010.1 hypothetical protein EHW97_14740 [Aeromicrobium camelliae]
MLGLGTAGTVILVGGALIIALVVALGLWLVAAPLVLVWLLALGAVGVRDRHGRNLAMRVGNRVGWSMTRRRGQNLYRGGPTTHGSFTPPGILATTKLHEARDAYDRPFAVIEYPAVGHYAVAVEVSPEGASLVDADQVDVWVAGWGQWLANLGQELGVVGAQVTVETAPDTGARLKREVQRRLDPNAPDLAKAVLGQVVHDYPAGASLDRAWVTVTFRGQSAAGPKRTTADVIADLASRLPGLTETLAGSTGAGAATPVTAQGLCEIVRTAYDPGAAALLDEIHDSGQQPDLSWNDAGPAAAEASWDTYRHDGAVSRSWYMSSAPRGEVFANVLTRLLSAHADVDRKRIAIMYQPLSSVEAAAVVEADKRAADLRVNATNRPSSRALAAARASRATADEEARGAGLVDFGMVITATVTDPDRLTAARVAVENLAAGARLLIRPAWGSQDAAFAAGLPLGLVLRSHSRVPQEIRRYL